MSQNVIQITHILELLEREKDHRTGGSGWGTRYLALPADTREDSLAQA
jgi:hypothetical protein